MPFDRGPAPVDANRRGDRSDQPLDSNGGRPVGAGLVEWWARVVALVKEVGSRSTTLVAITTQKEMRVFAKVEIR